VLLSFFNQRKLVLILGGAGLGKASGSVFIFFLLLFKLIFVEYIYSRGGQSYTFLNKFFIG
jgi:hypothetical protein